MKKARSRSKQFKMKTIHPDAISVVIIRRKYLKEFPKDTERRVYAIQGMINQVVAAHNDLIATRENVIQSNRQAITDAMDALEEQIDSKLEYLNNFMDREFDKARGVKRHVSRKAA